VETRRLFLAILLSLVVLLAWQYLIGPPVPPPEPPPPAGGEAPAPRAPEPTPATAAEASPPASSQEGEPAVDGEPQEPVAASREQTRTLETSRIRAVFSNRGGQLVSFVLKEHDTAEGEPMDLVRSRHQGPYPFGLTSRDRQPHPLDGVLFQVEDIPEGVRFVYSGPQGRAEKTFRLESHAAANLADLLRVDVTVYGEEGWGLVLGPGLRNTTPEQRAKNRYERRTGFYMQSGELERIDMAKAAEPTVVPGAGLSWVGLDDTYFLTAVLLDARTRGVEDVVFEPLLLVPGPSGQGAVFEPLPPADQMTRAQEDLDRTLLLTLEPGAEHFTAVAYFGAKQLERLSNLPGNLVETINLGGPLRLLADPLLRGLHWIHDRVVPNYGWAIVLMTLVLKIILFPLTHKSYMSARKMQELNPKIQALRAKYRPKMKDKQGRPNLEAQRKMNEEMMALYKSEGVNPAGGCLPMLLQMPVLFAFYYILRAAVELRHAPWMLWITDLSVYDPFFVLPVVMAGTQFLQQRLTPMAGDPMQRRLFQLMPLFMLFLFLWLPSGLVLYWLTNNVLTIAQQSIYNHLKKRGSTPDGSASSRPDAGKKGKRSETK
jgi:YidC/Oxa1 family membrane protein insertase